MTTIDGDKIGLIERLFAQGAELPAIAAATGCAASSVRKVLAGRHGSQLRGRPDRDCGVRSRPLPAERCPDCGGRIVESPCRLCLTLAWPIDERDPPQQTTRQPRQTCKG